MLQGYFASSVLRVRSTCALSSRSFCSKKIPWGYRSSTGPDFWRTEYKHNCGLCQSPIDIVTKSTQYSSKLQNTNLSQWLRNSHHPARIHNTGAGWQVDTDSNPDIMLSGGCLKNFKYTPLQFHMHWGNHTGCGAEHLVDGKSAAAEIHFVHSLFCQYKQGIGADFLDLAHGLCVLGVRLEYGQHNLELQKIVDCLSKIRYKEQSTDSSDFSVESFCTNNDFNSNAFFTYHGSLTTPPLKECVRWIVFRDTIQVSKDQVEAMRQLYDYSNQDKDHTKNLKEGSILRNVRPTQPIEDRIVYRSFE